jgi:hypothetical protein
MKNDTKEIELNNSFEFAIETAFRKYYARCTGKDLVHMFDKQILLFLNAI